MSLEFATPPDGDNVDYAEFSQDNKQHFNEIQSFIMIVKDWVEEMVHDSEAFTKPKPRLPPRKVQSSLYLEKA